MATDDFNRANSGNLGANWGISGSSDGTQGYGISSNEALTTSALCANWYDAETLNNDHWSEVVLGSVVETGATGGHGAAWRMTNGLTVATTSFYYASASNAATGEIRYGKWVNGTHTPIGVNNTGPTPATGTVLRGGSEGNTHRVYVGGSELLNFSDSSNPTSGRAGLYGDPENVFGTLNSWQSGNFALPEFDGRWELQESTDDWLLEDGSGYWVGETFTGVAGGASLLLRRRDRGIVALF